MSQQLDAILDRVAEWDYPLPTGGQTSPLTEDNNIVMAVITTPQLQEFLALQTKCKWTQSLHLLDVRELSQYVIYTALLAVSPGETLAHQLPWERFVQVADTTGRLDNCNFYEIREIFVRSWLDIKAAHSGDS